MKRWILITWASLVSLACTGPFQKPDLPSIQADHPVGYLRLTDLAPECSRVNYSNYSSCLVAARMLEASTPKISTHRFLEHWLFTVFGSTENKDTFEATGRIAIPVLKFLYESSPDRYSQIMLSQLGNINLASKESYEDFRGIHLKTMRGH